ncbi:MAG TPA: serine/threonine-protein kinase [Streptosporangiaceae bacterium]|nr:serine/threonine-protein kinase [Streptosporangiaceae bacterium]
MWRVSGFTELRELGSGAQGRVVLARHDRSGQLVAIKYVFTATAVDEARLLRAVDDPHVARLYDYVERPGEGAALLMEAVDGVSLRAVLDEHGALTPEVSLVILKGSLLGLAAAHARGVVHRDYKPANVVVQRDGQSKLIDFGVAVVDGVAGGSGTPAYMSPEQWLRQPATPSTDVYAATCVFFECVTGHRPYLEDVSAGHLTGGVPTGEVPEQLRSLVARGMAKTASARPPGAAAFVTELEQIAGEAYGPDWERRGLVVLGTVAVSLAALSPLAFLSGGTTMGAVQAGGQSVARTTFRTGIRGAAKGAAVKTAAVGVAVVLAAGGAAVAYKAAFTKPTPHKPAAAVPMIVYVTGTSVVLRTGTGPARVLGTVKQGQSGPVSVSHIVWSPDGRRVAWLVGWGGSGQVSETDVRGGPIHTWNCSCWGIGFQGGRLLSDSNASTNSYDLMVYPADGSAPVPEPVTGLIGYLGGPPTSFPGSGGLVTFSLHMVTASGAVIVGFTDGASSRGGPQALYQVDGTGRATPIQATSGADQLNEMGNMIPSDFVASPDGRTIGFVVGSHDSVCLYSFSAVLLDPASGKWAGTGRTPNTGQWVIGGIWFDRTGAAYKSAASVLVASVSSCTTNPGPPADYKLEGGTWTKVGQGTIKAGFGPPGWQATLTGTLVVNPATGTLTLAHGATTSVIPGVTDFAWAP